LAETLQTLVSAAAMMLVSENSPTSIVLTSDRMFLVLGHPMIVEMISYRSNGRDQSGRGMGGRQLSFGRRSSGMNDDRAA